MDSTVLAALISGAFLILTTPGLFAWRATRRLHQERETVAQQTVGLDQFKAYTAAMDKRDVDRDHDMAKLTLELRETNRLLRITVMHIDRLYAWSKRPTDPIPGLPAELADMPVFYNPERRPAHE